MTRMSVIWAKQTWGVTGGGLGKGVSKQASLGKNRGAPTWVAYPAPSPFQTDLGSHARTPPLYPRGRVRRSCRGHVWRRKCRCRTAVPSTQKHSGQAHQPATGGGGVLGSWLLVPHTHPSAAARCTPPLAVLQGQAKYALVRSRRGRRAKAARARTPGLVPWPGPPAPCLWASDQRRP